MGRRLIVVESDSRGLRSAMLADDKMQALEIDRPDVPQIVGATATAKVIRTVAGLGTTIAVSNGAEALLDRAGQDVPLRSGAEIIVQITKPARGAKLAGASLSIALTGRALVHLPLETGIKVSRRLEIGADARQAIETALLGLPGGWIVRRNAAALSPQAVAREARALVTEGRASMSGKGIAPNAFRRLIDDYGADGAVTIHVAGLAAKTVVDRWRAAFAPDLSDGIEIVPPGLFDRHDLDSAIAALMERQIVLAGGGSLVIDRTEALTAIDVNAGPQANALAVNLDAAQEIARQLRLRHIGGIVVIDFVSMPRRSDQARVVDLLNAALADDPSQTRALPMSAFGLVEMIRDRRGPGLDLAGLELG